MKNIIILLIALIFILGCVQQSGQNQTGLKIKIGVIESLSGNAAYYGEENRKGVEMAKDEMQNKFGDVMIEVFHEDSLYTAQGGVSAYRKLKDTQDLDAIITHASPVSLAVQPLANNDSVLQMAVSSSAKAYSSPKDLSFRTSPTTDIEAQAISDFIVNRGFENISILYMNNEIGLSIATSVKKGVQDKASIVMEEGFGLDTTDFRTQLLKAKNSGTDAMFVPALASHIAIILRQARENGMYLQFIGFRASEDPVLVSNAGELADGVVYSYGFDPLHSHPDFVESFKMKYGKLPDGYAAEGYEGLKITVEALVECKKDLECSKNYIQNLKNYTSVFGNLSFDENGDVYYEFFMKTIRNGTFVRVD